VVCRRTHHHHVICSQCGRTNEIDDGDLRAVVNEIARRTGYRVDDHRLELFGLCPVCVASQPTPATATA
jgi:Fur family ferric uptake transcriptional regulator